MKVKIAIAAAVLLANSSGLFCAVNAQGLPPTNMGKFVHQPGDNQYAQNAQQERHGNSYADRTGPGTSVFYGQGGGGNAAMAPMGPMVVNPMILMGSTRPKVDISIEPISADEPVPPPGFPPLPERLQLPIAALPGSSGSSWKGGNGGGAGNDGGSNSAIQGVHQHYVHLKPGAFVTPSGGGGDGGGAGEDSGPPPSESAVPGVSDQSSIGGAGGGAQIQNPAQGGVGYYKARQAPPINIERANGMLPPLGGGDNFNSGGPSAPRYSGASSGDLKKLGKAPKLDDKQDGGGAPEAPQAAIVTQSTTQDLSLPDDEFVSRYNLQDSASKKFGRAAGRTVYQTGRRVLQRGTGMIGF